MKEKNEKIHYNFKGLLKYVSTIISWTIFVLLSIIGVLLIYYYISLRLYSTYGEKFEPRFSVYTIVSPSMEPTIKVYDVIINSRVDSIDDIKINDVITFISTWDVTQGMTITHRVSGFKTTDEGEKCVITRGDNNTSDDQACVKEGNIIGITKGVIPSLGRVQYLLTSSGGWLLIIIVLGIYLIVKNIFRLFKIINVKEEEYKIKKMTKEETRLLQSKYSFLQTIIKRRKE